MIRKCKTCGSFLIGSDLSDNPEKCSKCIDEPIEDPFKIVPEEKKETKYIGKYRVAALIIVLIVAGIYWMVKSKSYENIIPGLKGLYHSIKGS